MAAQKPVSEWLADYFGESAKNIEGFDNPCITDTITNRPTIIADKGRLFLSCGGLAIMGFNRSDNIRGSIFLVIDDSEGNAWEAEQRSREGHLPTRPRPSERLKLAYSA